MPRPVGFLSKFTLDITALRRSRDYRVLELGAIVSGLGTQAALVAIPFQVYILTRSTALVGLIGAAELGPTVLVSLFGGAIADRVDRRRILLVAQVLTSVCAGALAVLAFAGRPPVWLIFVLAAALAASGTLDFIARSSMIAGLAGEWLRSAIAFNFGMNQVTAIVGPGLGGVVIGAAGVGWVYAADAVSVAASIFAALTIAPQRPHAHNGGEPILASVAAGLRYVRSSNALLGSFVIDLFAMTFGMPRALFSVLSLTVFHAGAEGAGLLYASVSIGAAAAALTNAWLAHARWIGRITIAMVLIWGAAIAATAVAPSLALAAILLAVAGAADSISAVCRTTIAQLVTPDALRGRMTAVFGLVVTGGARLGDIESGTVASLTSPRFSVLSGGLACFAGVGLVLLAFPGLARFDAHEHAYAVKPVAA
jgi:Transmembrane secretion effector